MSEPSTYQDFSAKARCAAPDHLRRQLAEWGAHHVGTDHQRDTYFATDRGKLKLREGNIEHLLIHYERRLDAHGTERTRVYRYDSHPTPAHVAAVVGGQPVLGVVAKTRDIYRLGPLKIHLGAFPNGDQFVEVEAQDHTGERTPAELRAECLGFLQRLGISSTDLLTNGYLPT